MVPHKVSPITEGPCGGQPDHRTDQDCKVEEANHLRAVRIWWVAEVLGLSEVDGQERAAAPGDDEGSELDDRESE